MPANAKSAATSAAKRTRTAPNVIDCQRQTYIALIGQARALGSGNALVDKAQSLLTAHWGQATWETRGAILKSVDWLLRVALHHPLPPSKARARSFPGPVARGGPLRHH